MRRLLGALSLVLVAAPAFAQDGSAVYAQRCASCHENGAANRAPTRDAIAAQSADRIVEALETGVMRIQGESMTPQERRAVALFLSRAINGAPAASPAPASPANSAAPPSPASAAAPASAASTSQAPACSGGNASFATAPERNWASWGVTPANDRFQRSPGLTAAQVPTLTLKWAFGFEGDTTAATQPIVAGDRVFVGSNGGRVFSLGLKDGCVQWTFKADGGIRAAMALAADANGARLFLGDLRATVYALDAATGALRWKQRVEEHRASRISGSPVVYNGVVYVPVSSSEEATGAMANYECCTFRGSVAALDAATGSVLWKTFTIPDAPKPTAKNKAGTQLWGPSGVAVWSSPTIDARTNSLYVATGDSYTQPSSDHSDAVLALDLKTGAIKWAVQLLKGDAWNMACGTPNPANCPENEGPDFDFGQSPILTTLPSGRRILTVGQKSSVVYGIDPDERGKVLWTTKIGKGGMLGGAEWGSASDGTNVYVPLSDFGFAEGRRGLDPNAGGGVFAIRIADGTLVWSAKPPACGENCSPAQPAPASVMPGAVFAGSLDGHLRAYATGDGTIIWDFNTARDFDTVNGVKASGGSIDVGGPAIANGMVLTTSGYPTWGGKRGNVLLAFGLP